MRSLTIALLAAFALLVMGAAAECGSSTLEPRVREAINSLPEVTPTPTPTPTDDEYRALIRKLQPVYDAADATVWAAGDEYWPVERAFDAAIGTDDESTLRPEFDRLKDAFETARDARDVISICLLKARDHIKDDDSFWIVGDECWEIAGISVGAPSA